MNLNTIKRALRYIVKGVPTKHITVTINQHYAGNVI